MDPTVFNPQYNLQVRLDSIHTALSQLAAQTGVYLTNPPVVQVDESVFDEVCVERGRERKRECVLHVCWRGVCVERERERERDDVLCVCEVCCRGLWSLGC